MIDGKKPASAVVLAVFCLVCFGCSGLDLPELGYVTGTVTRNGEPLEGVVVEFYSDTAEGGRPGVGVTNSEGFYELKYTGGVEGTKVGPAKVSVTTEWPEGEPSEGESEEIPVKYNSKSTLKKTVEPGNNVIDLELEF